MTNIVEKASRFSQTLLKEKLPSANIYHNLNHTKQVVKNAKEIASNCDLTENEIEIIMLSAWFHDTGFINKYEDHESESVKIAEEFLFQNNYNKKRIIKIKDCIKKTNINFIPKTKLEKILCEADLLYLSKPNFIPQANLLRKEWENIGIKYSDKNWLELNINFMRSRPLFTKYGKEKYSEQRKKNIKKLELLYSKV